MKRKITILFTALMAFSLASCGSSVASETTALETESEEKSSEVNQETETISETETQPNVAVEVSQIVEFGQYPQTSNGSEQDIQWKVLAVDGDKVLLLSEYALDVKPFNDNEETITWAECSLRTWLDSDFINTAFTDAEQSEIIKVSNQNDANDEYGTSGGKATDDQIFLLSISEVNEYLGSADNQTCEATDYAKKKGADVNELNGNTWWWLRTPGYSQKRAAGVFSVGYVDEDGGRVNQENLVRPALWVNIEYFYKSTTEKDSSDNNNSVESKSTSSSTSFTNEYGTATTKCAVSGCNNYIASSGDTNCCEEHSNRCLNCGKYIDGDATYCIDCLTAVAESKNASSSTTFTNKYGTATTKCAVAGCNNYIASSGDTNCCVEHSNRCLNCGKYIDGDATYCIDCLTAAAEQHSSDNSSKSQ